MESLLALCLLRLSLTVCARSTMMNVANMASFSMPRRAINDCVLGDLSSEAIYNIEDMELINSLHRSSQGVLCVY